LKKKRGPAKYTDGHGQTSRSSKGRKGIKKRVLG